MVAVGVENNLRGSHSDRHNETSQPPKPDPVAEKAICDLIDSIHLERRGADEDLRMRIDGVKSNVIVSIQTNGLSNILATKTRRELRKAIRANVTIKLHPRTNNAAEVQTSR